MEIKDTFKTIALPSPEILFKEKNSKFFGYAFPVTQEQEIKLHVEHLRKQHQGAVHFCYAFQLGTETIQFRASDDGEPGNSAGMPIYGQIQSLGLTNVLVVIVRFFGGVKLGVGGLISAYRTAARMALENATIIEKKITTHYQIFFEYKNINKVLRIIKEKNLDIISQQMQESCMIEIATRKKNAEMIFDLFKNVFEVEIKKI